MPARSAPRPLSPAPLVALALVLAIAGPRTRADVVKTASGLTLEGTVEKQTDGSVALTTPEGTVRLGAKEVVSVTPGEGPRTAFAREVKAAEPADAAAWYRLALRADELGLVAERNEAHAKVVAIDADHAASRRALGHERVDGTWLPADEARRRKGFVLFAGEWRLPEEVEATQAAAAKPHVPAPGSDDTRIRGVLRQVASKDAALSEAARRALTGASRRDLVAAALGLLGDSDAAVRATCCRLLGEWGDESALRALVFHGARDLDADVRREAVLAAASFGHDDTAIPFVRALGSTNERLVANAAQALGLLADQRTAGYVVKRLESHGSAQRSFVSFLNQVSYVRDYDVEIAQASNIANPNIGTILDGVVLDVHVKGTEYTTTWVEPYLVEALGNIAGRRFADAADARAWYAENRDRLPDFAKKPAARAPRKAEGRAVGLPPIR
jgi:hypothetical protein